MKTYRSGHLHPFIAVVVAISAGCGSGSPNGHEASAVSITTLEVFIEGSYAEQFDFALLQKRASAILLVTTTDKVQSDDLADGSAPNTVTLATVDRTFVGTGSQISGEIWVRQVGAPNTSRSEYLLKTGARYLVFAERYVGPSNLKLEQWVILGGDQGLYAEDEAGVFQRFGSGRPVTNPVSIQVVDGALIAQSTRERGDELCAQLESLLENQLVADGVQLMTDLRGLDITFLDAARQDAFVGLLDLLQADIDAFGRGEVNKWGTATLVAAIQPDCPGDFSIQSATR